MGMKDHEYDEGDSLITGSESLYDIAINNDIFNRHAIHQNAKNAKIGETVQCAGCLRSFVKNIRQMCHLILLTRKFVCL